MMDAEQKFWSEKFDRLNSDWHEVYQKLLLLVEKSATEVEASKNQVATLNGNFSSLKRSNWEKYGVTLLPFIFTVILVVIGLIAVNYGFNFKVGSVEITKQQNCLKTSTSTAC